MFAGKVERLTEEGEEKSRQDHEEYDNFNDNKEQNKLKTISYARTIHLFWLVKQISLKENGDRCKLNS